MTTATLVYPPSFLKLLAHELRWRLVEALAWSDRRVQELAAVVGEPHNLVSYHLRRLRDQALVSERRSAADRRDVYYSLDLDRLKHLYFAAAESLHPGISDRPHAASGTGAGRTRRARVLFLCTHNSARSQMAEGILRHLGGHNVEVYSAGTVATRVHPVAITVMAEKSIDISGQRSKHMDEFAGQEFDYVVTVCDNAREACPAPPGDPERIHWSIADPSAVEGDESTRSCAFRIAADELVTRMRYFLQLIQSQHRPYARSAGQELKLDLAAVAYSGDDMFPFPQTASSKEDVMAQNEMDSQKVEEKDLVEGKDLEGVAGGLASRIGACACDCEDGCCSDCET
jgi:thioredoxin type arsenate reductase